MTILELKKKIQNRVLSQYHKEFRKQKIEFRDFLPALSPFVLIGSILLSGSFFVHTHNIINFFGFLLSCALIAGSLIFNCLFILEFLTGKFPYSQKKFNILSDSFYRTPMGSFPDFEKFEEFKQYFKKNSSIFTKYDGKFYNDTAVMRKQNEFIEKNFNLTKDELALLHEIEFNEVQKNFLLNCIFEDRFSINDIFHLEHYSNENIKEKIDIESKKEVEEELLLNNCHKHARLLKKIGAQGQLTPKKIISQETSNFKYLLKELL